MLKVRPVKSSKKKKTSSLDSKKNENACPASSHKPTELSSDSQEDIYQKHRLLKVKKNLLSSENYEIKKKTSLFSREKKNCDLFQVINQQHFPQFTCEKSVHKNRLLKVIYKQHFILPFEENCKCTSSIPVPQKKKKTYANTRPPINHQ